MHAYTLSANAYLEEGMKKKLFLVVLRFAAAEVMGLVRRLIMRCYAIWQLACSRTQVLQLVVHAVAHEESFDRHKESQLMMNLFVWSVREECMNE